MQDLDGVTWVQRPGRRPARKRQTRRGPAPATAQALKVPKVRSPGREGGGEQSVSRGVQGGLLTRRFQPCPLLPSLPPHA